MTPLQSLIHTLERDGHPIANDLRAEDDAQRDGFFDRMTDWYQGWYRGGPPSVTRGPGEGIAQAVGFMHRERTRAIIPLAGDGGR